MPMSDKAVEELTGVRVTPKTEMVAGEGQDEMYHRVGPDEWERYAEDEPFIESERGLR